MAKQHIKIGDTPNDRTGDPLREAFKKVNDNFTELYAHVSYDTQIPLQTSHSGKYLTTNGTALSWGTVSIPTLTSQLINNSNFVIKDTAPATLAGEEGDVAGTVAFDNTYIYYCTDNYVDIGGGSGTATLVPNQLGQTVNLITIQMSGPGNTDWALPQVGWTLTVDTTTVTIEEITTDADFVYIVVSGFITLPMTDGITFTEGGGVQPDIWVRQRWGVENETTNQLVNSSYNVTLDVNGNTTFPTQGYIKHNNSYTKTSTSIIYNTNPAVVWTASGDYISGVKLMIQVEASENGDATGWHSQVCEAVIASRGYANGVNGYGDPAMTVYGLVYTSTVSLVTFTVQRNPSTKLIEVVGTPAAEVAPIGAALRIYSVETVTMD